MNENSIATSTNEQIQQNSQHYQPTETSNYFFKYLISHKLVSLILNLSIKFCNEHLSFQSGKTKPHIIFT